MTIFANNGRHPRSDLDSCAQPTHDLTGPARLEMEDALRFVSKLSELHEHFLQESRVGGLSKSLDFGPYEITMVISPVTYRSTKLPIGAKTTHSFHVSLLLPAASPSYKTQLALPGQVTEPPPPIEIMTVDSARQEWESRRNYRTPPP